VEDLRTAHGQLAVASEFRFDYWHTRSEHQSYTVRRGVGKLEHRWAICHGGELGEKWNGEEWCMSLYKEDAYRFELEEALLIARHLAFEENQRTVARMERMLPGEIRGSAYDQATWKEKE
jgi:hypothetical protein